MIYDKLRTLPKVIQMEIYETGDLSLLSDEEKPLEELAIIWVELDDKFNQKYNKKGVDKVFNLEKEINYQEKRFLIIELCCEQLLFSKDEKIISLLKSEGYKFDENSPNYKSQIDNIHREAKGITININRLKAKLPKIEEESVKSENSIIDVMASYSAVLNVAFDFNSCSVEAFHAYEYQVKTKIKHLESQSKKK